jgi:predicted glycosyltransferase
MDSTINLLLTSTNYFQWKSHMEDLLRSKGLYQITLGKETTPTDADKKVKWDNRNGEARELIRMFSPDLRFHLQSIDKPKEAQLKIDPSNIDVIVNWPEPKSVTEIQIFLGAI